jgi:AcrR family transcriptional regulator
MTDPKVVPIDAGPASHEMPDGRRQRSERSRAQIIEALFGLIQEGDMSPSAAKVAERAKVGLRTVFRHFEDMDSLYGEMSRSLTAEILPGFLAPFEATDWHGRFLELIGRRIDIYERIFQIRVSANVRRFQSRFLMDEYRRNLLIERSSLQAVLPDEIRNDKIRFAAIEAAAGFQSWRRLRTDQDLSKEDAAAAVTLTLEHLVGP